jgi:hypothetical protein
MKMICALIILLPTVVCSQEDVVSQSTREDTVDYFHMSPSLTAESDAECSSYTQGGSSSRSRIGGGSSRRTGGGSSPLPQLFRFKERQISYKGSDLLIAQARGVSMTVTSVVGVIIDYRYKVETRGGGGSSRMPSRTCHVSRVRHINQEEQEEVTELLRSLDIKGDINFQ